MAVVNFVWDPLNDNVLKETDETNATTVNYTTAPNQFGETLSQHQQSGGDTYLHYDGLGCTRNLTSSTETVVRTNTYTGFGETVSSFGLHNTAFGWNGAYGYYTDDETVDFYVRRRTYSPEYGRWRSCDPLRFVDGPNLYVYLGNLPIGSFDPSGMIRLITRGGDPKYPGSCGGLTHRANWKLEANEENGYIIQLVCGVSLKEQCPDEEEVDCTNGFPGGQNQATCPGHCYLELWEIRDGNSVGGIELTDTFQFPSCDRTKGINIQCGNAVFVQSDWIEDNDYGSMLDLFVSGNNGVASAGDLRSVCYGDSELGMFWEHARSEFGDTGTNRCSKFQWDCCCGRKRVICKESYVNRGPTLDPDLFP